MEILNNVLGLWILLYTWYMGKVYANSECPSNSKYHIIKDWGSSDDFRNQRPCDMYKMTGDAHYFSCHKLCWDLQPCYHYTLKDNINCYMCIDQNHVLVSGELESSTFTLSQGDRLYEKTDIDDCWAASCLNGGTCNDKEYGYLCQCPSGYGGKFCHLACYVNNTYELYYDTGNEAWPSSNWDSDVFCPSGSYAAGFQMLFEPYQFILDDTAVNKLRLICKFLDNTVATTIETGQNIWGNWNSEYYCPDNYFITAFQQQADPISPNTFVVFVEIETDDGGVSNFNFRCTGPGLNGTDVQIITDPNGGVEGAVDEWGYWTEWSESCADGEAVCGMAARYVPSQGTAPEQDDGGMVNIKMHCCGCEDE